MSVSQSCLSKCLSLYGTHTCMTVSKSGLVFSCVVGWLGVWLGSGWLFRCSRHRFGNLLTKSNLHRRELSSCRCACASPLCSSRANAGPEFRLRFVHFQVFSAPITPTEKKNENSTTQRAAESYYIGGIVEEGSVFLGR